MKNEKQTSQNHQGHAPLTDVMPRYLFGEWVLIDNEKSGQIIECHGNSCIVDENGMWSEYQKDRLTKDTRYLTPAEFHEANGAQFATNNNENQK